MICAHLLFSLARNSERAIRKVDTSYTGRPILGVPQSVLAGAAAHIEHLFPLIILRRYPQAFKAPAHLLVGTPVQRPRVLRVHADNGFLDFLDLGRQFLGRHINSWLNAVICNS